MDKFNAQDLKVHQLRSIVSRKSGLPVSVFRLTTVEGTEMYDCQFIDSYGIGVGDRIVLEVWDGWSDMLNAAITGFTSDLMESLFKDDVISRFQMKVALYIAAHYGHVELAVNLLRHGVRPDEAIGEHPLRQWCKGEESHIDTFKAAIHESAESGQLNVLRSFVHHSVTSVLAKDGNGLTALNISLRMKQRHCASFLLTKQWSKIQYTKKASLPLSIYTKMKKWCEHAKTKTLVIHGHYKSSIKNYKRHLAQGALVGHGLQLDGFGQSKLSTKPLNLLKIEEEESEKRKKRLYGIDPPSGQMDPEIYFKSLSSVALMRSGPKLGKWGKLVSKANNLKKSTSEDSNHEDKESESLKLPPIKENMKKKPFDPSRRSFLLQTGAESVGTRSNPETERSDKKSSFQLRKKPSQLAPIKRRPVKPLPADLRKTMEEFDFERGMKARENAIKCLSVATTFEKPWLQQIRLALNIARTGVRKILDKKPYMFSFEESEKSSRSNTLQARTA
ncbi:DgyrCDS9620 [Dimorphilus gyrociliatus]|nr:DgyrCDS9620 [Dimorphilus gyrociliatus]